MNVNLSGRRAYHLSYLFAAIFVLYGFFLFFSQQSLLNDITTAKLAGIQAYYTQRQQDAIQRLTSRAESISATIAKLASPQLENIQSYGLQKEGLAVTLEPFMDYPEIAGIEVTDRDGRACAAMWKEGERKEFRTDYALPSAFRKNFRLVMRNSALTTAGAQGTITVYVDDRPISHSIARVKDELKRSAQEEVGTLKQHFRGTLLPQVAAFALGIGFIILFSRVIVRSYATIEKQRHELEIFNRQLEQMVEERTRELREAQGKLISASRKAGMAEVATNVLHSVGNVLNSVNISASMVNARMENSKAKGLEKAVRLFKEHAEDLGEYLTRDERGKLLPEYLDKLSRAVAVEQSEIAEELAQLTRSVDHIKEIVAIQQAHAGSSSSIVERVTVQELVEDALRMKGEDLSLNEVTVLQELESLPSLPLDKTRVLQILVNLIDNATKAVAGVAVDNRLITLRASLRDGSTLRIAVQDGGIGIAAENLTRIFNHGFTTRRDGHGFGLHSCALTAKEMGGSLTAHSDGPGTGATFTLELPTPPSA